MLNHKTKLISFGILFEMCQTHRADSEPKNSKQFIGLFDIVGKSTQKRYLKSFPLNLNHSLQFFVPLKTLCAISNMNRTEKSLPLYHYSIMFCPLTRKTRKQKRPLPRGKSLPFCKSPRWQKTENFGGAQKNEQKFRTTF